MRARPLGGKILEEKVWQLTPEYLLARIPRTEEPGGLQAWGRKRVQTRPSNRTTAKPAGRRPFLLPQLQLAPPQERGWAHLCLDTGKNLGFSTQIILLLTDTFGDRNTSEILITFHPRSRLIHSAATSINMFVTTKKTPEY